MNLTFTEANSLVQLLTGSFFRIPGSKKSKGDTDRLALMPPQPAQISAGNASKHSHFKVERTC